MPFGEVEDKALAQGIEPLSEPCYKRVKSAEEEADTPAHLHTVEEEAGSGWAPVPPVPVLGHQLQEDTRETTELPRPLGGLRSPGVSREDGIYSTSTAFIGPLYKPSKRKGHVRRSQASTPSTASDIQGQKEEHEVDLMDSELSQFYREIEALEKTPEDLESSWQDPAPCAPSEEPGPCPQGQPGDLPGVSEQPASDDVAWSPGVYPQFVESTPVGYPCARGSGPLYSEATFAPFRPGWQYMPAFLMPDGPAPQFPPGISYPVHVQRFQVLPDAPPTIFQVPDHTQVWNGYYMDACPSGWSSPAPGQASGCPGGLCRDGHSEPPGQAPWDNFGTGVGHWEDPPRDVCPETDTLVKQEFQEEKLEKLQKLLILLRGLPGSGKTTLSRTLLGQSQDGIVFSTDDYFRYHDGYRYDVNQLSNAHDWNQSRAKQAIAQGRSPVIIDNTNTQAWEMKPYVEMAIGRGYRVEFHEPETWWKFDPEELEKRNKHGVSRKKIAQMLERYEFQMSIAIVMNSVEPAHKGAQRLPPPEWRPRCQEGSQEAPECEEKEVEPSREELQRARTQRASAAPHPSMQKREIRRTRFLGQQRRSKTSPRVSIEEEVDTAQTRNWAFSSTSGSDHWLPVGPVEQCWPEESPPPAPSLTPPDCMVPLDLNTMKLLYLQWKTSVEKRQKKIA
ncbi:PREDICTED: NEDD4-binding protein 2-like 2 [Elephantulus edwardii]|uniref:NEDD4-binding protein 2-like 2 n=1 Tax=Elephantulus edwardii TaxID=28737 RepID=UPI0003F0EC4B|nr:PREDICTED: NEDD4-binding protein 2-like 2 [Elephantulus edwardii]